MASTKIILRTDKANSKGDSPLFLRIIKHRKSSFVSIGLRVKEKDWDSVACKVKKSHKNSARLNAFIAQKVAEAESLIVESETTIKTISSHRLKARVMGVEPTNFFDYAKRYINSLLSGGQISTYKRANAVIEKLKEYNDQKPLYLEDITHTYLQDFSNHCKTKLNNKPNTIHGNLRIIRKIINDSIKDGLLSRDDNPFLKLTLKAEASKRSYLTDDELKSIEELDLSGQQGYRQTRDMFVFACYSGGIRISDLMLLKWRDIADGKVNIQMKKTGGLQAVKLPNKALDILEKFKTDDSKPTDFVFPYIHTDAEIDTPMKLHDVIGRKTALVNKNLKEIAKKAEINKHITFHVSRHTFATSALRKGIRIEYVSKLLGHSDLKETQVYAKIINAELDKAMDIFNQ